MVSLEVLAEPTFPLSLADFKLHANVNSPDVDSSLLMYLKAAAACFQFDSGYPLGTHTYRYRQTLAGPVLALPRHPVQAVTAVSLDGVALAGPGWGVVGSDLLVAGGRRGNEAAVVFSAGTATVPNDVRLAVFQLAQHYYLEGSAQTADNLTDTPMGYARVVTHYRGTYL